MQKLLIYICISLICASCAQITPLTGGKKDIEPPKVLKIEPKNATTNFSAREIVIQFNEYIVLKDITNQFIITPQLKQLPEIEANGKTLKIKLNEDLLPNTTYKLFFGNAITDLKEANVLQNFEYIFSTGNTIDSLFIKGRITNYFNKKAEPQLMVGLYASTANDSTVYKNKPFYITKTDNNGEFRFNYLPNTNFKIVGIKDQNKNLLYDGSEEQIAFFDSAVNPIKLNNIDLVVFKEIPTKSFIKKASHVDYGKAIVVFNKPQHTITNVVANKLNHFSLNKTKDTVSLYYTDISDTLKAFINYSNKVSDTVSIRITTTIGREKITKEESLRYILKSNTTTTLPFYDIPKIDLNFPISKKNIDKNKITLLEINDSIKKIKIFSLVGVDSTTTFFSVKADLKPETNYALTFKPFAIKGDQARRNDSITYNFITTSSDDYAKLNLKLFFPKKENYIVQLLNEKESVVKEIEVSFSLTSTSEKIIELENLIPGNYFIKIIEDANKNRVFDTGNYFSHQQPEIIFINDKPIKLLAGWEVESEWIVK